MTTEPIHLDAAAYVLGALAPEDRSRFERHLADCDECQRTVLQFSPLPGLLARVDVDDSDALDERFPPGASAPGSTIVRDAQNRVDRLGSRRRRWRRTVVGAVAAAAAMFALVFVLTDDEPTFGGPLEQLVIDADSGVTGTVAVSERDWGTRLEIDLFGVPERDRYSLWTVSTDGTWDLAGTWRYAPSGTCRVVGASPVTTADLVRVVVTSTEKSDELVFAVPS